MSGAATHTLGLLLEATGGRALGPISPRITFSGAAVDSRAVRPGQLFFALPGARADGFAFAGAAAKAGAGAVVVAAGRGRPAGCDLIPVVAVADPRRALGDLAAVVRRRFEGLVIGVAGSNGKTTSKELCAAALGAGGKVMRTPGNLNTDVGLPLSILGALGDESFWVLEMAMRGLGEVAYLARIARPDIGLVTNVGPEHLELLGSLDAVARANGELLQGLGPSGVAVIPFDEPRLTAVADAAAIPAARRVTFGGVAPGADVRVLETLPAGRAGAVVRYGVRSEPVVVRLPLPGEHNARNGAAALAVALAAGVPIGAAARAMVDVALPPHRSATSTLAGRTVLDDCYNANPASMSAALAALVAGVGAGARAFAVLGDMLEVGTDGELLHGALGAEAVAEGVAGLVTLGTLARHTSDGARRAGLPSDRVLHTADADAAARAIAAWSRPGDWILVKASRGMRLEHVVDALRRALALPAGGAS